MIYIYLLSITVLIQFSKKKCLFKSHKKKEKAFRSICDPIYKPIVQTRICKIQVYLIVYLPV